MFAHTVLPYSKSTRYINVMTCGINKLRFCCVKHTKLPYIQRNRWATSLRLSAENMFSCQIVFSHNLVDFFPVSIFTIKHSSGHRYLHYKNLRYPRREHAHPVVLLFPVVSPAGYLSSTPRKVYSIDWCSISQQRDAFFFGHPGEPLAYFKLHSKTTCGAINGLYL